MKKLGTTTRAILGLGLRATVAALVTLGAAQAAGFPAQPVTLIVPVPPGGTTDIAARTMAPALEKALGQSIVVDNRAGAGGNIGKAAVSRGQAGRHTHGLGPHR